MVNNLLCLTCRRMLDNPADRSSKNCGGDCLRCMAEFGDEDAQAEMDGLLSSPAPLDAIGDGVSWFPTK